jgi:hypothetical protein
MAEKALSKSGHSSIPNGRSSEGRGNVLRESRDMLGLAEKTIGSGDGMMGKCAMEGRTRQPKERR